ncbi:hypothetical protein [Actinomadura oligospora]|uniref:hypothetical protein n=1 Tax=Actinomadura oligospora TaxID=111804 RepID=UPI00047D5FC7|nr:hypothetical protein [Actinomadura oligospora]
MRTHLKVIIATGAATAGLMMAAAPASAQQEQGPHGSRITLAGEDYRPTTGGFVPAKDDFYPSTGGFAPAGEEYWPSNGG